MISADATSIKINCSSPILRYTLIEWGIVILACSACLGVVLLSLLADDKICKYTLPNHLSVQMYVYNVDKPAAYSECKVYSNEFFLQESVSWNSRQLFSKYDSECREVNYAVAILTNLTDFLDADADTYNLYNLCSSFLTSPNIQLC